METWVTRPERPEGAKDEVKQARRAKSRAEGPPTRGRGPEGPQTSSLYRVSLKKGTFLILFLFLFQKLDFTFSHVFWNQNFEPVSSSHSNNIHSESELPQKCMHICKLQGWTKIEIFVKVVFFFKKTDCSNTSYKSQQMSLKFKDTKQDHVGIFSPKQWGVTPFPQPAIYKDDTVQASLHKAEFKKIMSIIRVSVLVCFGQFRF